MPPLRFYRFLITLTIIGATSGNVFAQAMVGGSANNPYTNLTTLDAPPAEGGWQGLANVLKAVQPSVDTRLQPTAAQITTHIEQKLNQGQYQEALDMIEKRLADTHGQRGTDVQLMFQHARALVALGRPNEAVDIYTKMTTLYPELPEPWNNVAVIYADRGELDKAQDALQMALRANPEYAAARANMGDLQLLLALRTYQQAAQQGVPGMQDKAKKIETLLQDKNR